MSNLVCHPSRVKKLKRDEKKQVLRYIIRVTKVMVFAAMSTSTPAFAVSQIDLLDKVEKRKTFEETVRVIDFTLNDQNFLRHKANYCIAGIFVLHGMGIKSPFAYALVNLPPLILWCKRIYRFISKI